MHKKFALFLILIIPLVSNARMGKMQDFPYFIQNSQTEIQINKDGSYESLDSVTFRVLKEEAKKDLSLYKIQFDPSVEEVNIIEAYVENASVKTPVDKTNIQKSNLSTKGMGFVNLTEIAIAFSQIKAGSSVFLKLKSINKPGAFGKYFSKNVTYGDRYLEYQNTLIIKSPKELFFKTSDPNNILNVSQVKDKDGIFLFVAKLKMPHLNIAVDESGSIPLHHHTSLTVSNIENWGKLRQLINSKLSIQSQKEIIPQVLSKVLSTIPSNATFEDRLNIILSYISTEYDYLGDWRGAGKYIPKTLSKIVKDHFGDCKDFSTLFLSMARNIGIKADYALVERSYNSGIVSEIDMASLDFFNHMIVRVEHEGKTYWIDPTNKYSTGANARLDIVGKNAFILGENKNLFEKIENNIPTKQFISNNKIYTFTSTSDASVQSNTKIEGEVSKLLQDGFKGKSKIEFQDSVMNMIAPNEHSAVSNFDNNNFSEKSYYAMDLNSKYVTNSIALKDKNEQKNSLFLPNINYLVILSMIKKSDVGVLDLKLLPNIKNEYYYRNIFINGTSPRVCDIKSDWFDASRKIEKMADGIILKDTFELKKNILTPADYNQIGFETIIDDASNCFKSNELHYTFGSKKHIDNLSTFELTIAKLTPIQKIAKRREKALEIIDNQSEAKKIDSFNNEDARLMLEKNLTESPNDSESLRILGLYYSTNAYIVGNQFEENGLNRSLVYVDKALLADVKNNSAMIDKLRILIDMRLTNQYTDLLYKTILTWDKSKLTYRQARKIMYCLYEIKDKTNADKYYEIALKLAISNQEKANVMSRRANYHLDVQQYPLCIDYLKQSLSYYDKEAWAHGNLAICYLKLNQPDQAIESSKKALSIMNYGAARSTLADALITKGYHLEVKNDLRKAEEFYNLAVLEFPGVNSYLALVGLHLRNHQIEKAKDAAKKSLSYADNYTPTSKIDKVIRELFDNAKIAYP